MFVEQFNYSKGDYDDLCNFMDTDLTQSLSQCSDIEEMWLLFEDRLPLPHQQCYNSV